MKLIYSIIAFLVVGISATFASPADTTYTVLKDTTALKTRVNTYSKNLTTIESNFTQKKYMSVLTEPSESNGYFCYKNGTMIRWEYIEPFKYLIVINNGRLAVHDENKTNSYDLTSNKAFLEMNSKLGKILQGNVFIDQNDFACMFFENSQNYKLVLTPKAKAHTGFFSRVILYFDKKIFSVSRVVILELSGDKTDIEFTDRKINSPVPDEKFNLQ